MFVSCVRASGRGEAVWAGERGVFLNAGENPVEFSFAGGRFYVIPFSALFARIAGMLMGFLIFSCF